MKTLLKLLKEVDEIVGKNKDLKSFFILTIDNEGAADFITNIEDLPEVIDILDDIKAILENPDDYE